MTVLVTGGTGSVGLAIAETLCRAGREVLLHGSVPLAEAALRGWEGPAPEVVVGDVRDLDALLEVMRGNAVEAVVHGAAMTPDLHAERTAAARVMDVNCVGSLRTLQAAEDAGVGRFIYLGSIAAYGQSATTSEGLLVEQATPDRPVNLYEISKSAAEASVLRASHLLGMEAISLRLGDLFGKWEHQTGSRQTTSSIHQVTAHAHAGVASQLPRAGRKAWTYSEDVGRAVSRLLDVERFEFDIVNLSSHHVWSVTDWCERLNRHFPHYSYTVDEAGANVSMFADNAPMCSSRMMSQLGGWEPETSLEQAFDQYVSWLDSTGAWTMTSPEGR